MIASAFFWEYLFASLAVYWLLPSRCRLWFLASVSIGYLAIEMPHGSHMTPALHAAIMGSLAALCYASAPRTQTPRPVKPGTDAPIKRPWPPVVRSIVFWTLIGLILAYLLFTKYVLAHRHDVASLDSYVVPMGVSYLSFKLISAVVEFARGSIKNPAADSFLASVFIFPTLPAGPIERYDHFLTNRPTLKGGDILHGLSRIIVGFVKRFFVAEYFFGTAWNFVTSGRAVTQLAHLPPETVWRLAFYCVFYMYLDFSAYSDLAIGCCRLFGLRIMENFDWPLLAPNLPTFWRRWHMTLTGWCQSYIFMPVLGLTRRLKLATFCSFLVIGLWHGSAAATWPWALWGGYHGFGMIGHQYWAQLKRDRKWAWCNRWWWYGAGVAMTLAFVSVGDLLALCAPNNLHDVGTIFLRLAFIGGRHHGVPT